MASIPSPSSILIMKSDTCSLACSVAKQKPGPGSGRSLRSILSPWTAQGSCHMARGQTAQVWSDSSQISTAETGPHPSDRSCVQFLVDTLALGPVAPFDAAALVMVVGGVVVLLTWPENFGDASNRHTLGEQLRNAAMAIYSGQALASLRLLCVQAACSQAGGGVAGKNAQ